MGVAPCSRCDKPTNIWNSETSRYVCQNCINDEEMIDAMAKSQPLTKREQFAMAAIQMGIGNEYEIEGNVQTAIEYADELIRQLDKGNK